MTSILGIGFILALMSAGVGLSYLQVQEMKKMAAVPQPPSPQVLALIQQQETAQKQLLNVTQEFEKMAAQLAKNQGQMVHLTSVMEAIKQPVSTTNSATAIDGQKPLSKTPEIAIFLTKIIHGNVLTSDIEMLPQTPARDALLAFVAVNGWQTPADILQDIYHLNLEKKENLLSDTDPNPVSRFLSSWISITPISPHIDQAALAALVSAHKWQALAEIAPQNIADKVRLYQQQKHLAATLVAEML